MKVEGVSGIQFLFKYENLFLAGQPTADIINYLIQNKVKSIINMRSAGEVDDSEFREAVGNTNIEYVQVPVMGPAGLDKSSCTKISDLINDEETFFIHCGTANRVGGWLITDLVNRKGFTFDDAVEVALQNGLTNPGLIEMARNIL